MKKIQWISILSLLFLDCIEQEKFNVIYHIPSKENNEISQFSLMTTTSIDFQNQVLEIEELNFLNFSYIYNGAGVVTSDFNNDGLVDIFLLANQGENKLYLNKGELRFEDITNTAGVADPSSWTTGASVVDINNDGWLDIYICKSGMVKNNVRQNKLYINQQNNTFKESTKEWRLHDHGFSTQSYFLDFDKDGDLDMFLLNHRFDFYHSSLLEIDIEKAYSIYTSDKLFRNDGKYFNEVTETAGLTNSAWGLNASNWRF